jgi:hypothetical protein
MSKFLLNLLLQISKALVYSKINFLFGKEFSFTFGPISPAASRPSRGPLVFFQPAAPPLPTGPQPLGRPSRPHVGGTLPDCRLPFEKAYFHKTAFPSRMRTPQKIYHLRSAHISRPGHKTPPPTRPWTVTSPSCKPTSPSGPPGHLSLLPPSDESNEAAAAPSGYHRPALHRLLAPHWLHPRHETTSPSTNRTSRVGFSPLFGSLTSSKREHHCRH